MRHLPFMKCNTIKLFAAIFVVICQGRTFAEDPAAAIQQRLAAGEFGPALAAANAVNDLAQRDKLLGDIAAAQAAAGGRQAAFDTAGDISSDLARKAAGEIVAELRAHDPTRLQELSAR